MPGPSPVNRHVWRRQILSCMLWPIPTPGTICTVFADELVSQVDLEGEIAVVNATIRMDL